MSVTAKQMVDLYIEAEQELLAGKTTIINGRTFSMENLQEIRAGRQEWERRAAAELARQAGKGRRSPALASFY